MTHEEIIALAKEAGLPYLPTPNSALVRIVTKAVLIEREACAKVCEAEHVGADVCDDCDNELDETYNRALRDGATAIRERGAA